MRILSYPMIQSFLLALRFALWLPGTMSPFPVKRWLVERLGLLLLAVTLLAQWLYARHFDLFFDPVGVTATIGFIVVPCLIASLLSPAIGRGQMLAIFIWLQIFAKLACIFAHAAVGFVERHVPDSLSSSVEHWPDLILTYGLPAWSIGALIRAFDWIAGGSFTLVAARAMAVGTLVGSVGFILPDAWIFGSKARTGLENTVWANRAKTEPAADDSQSPQSKTLRLRRAAIELKQTDLLAQAFDQLKPRVAKRPNFYLLGVAGDMKADVFPKEIERGLSILSDKLGAPGHSVILSNHLDTVDDYPVASRQNIAAAIAGFGRHMDLATDLLVIVLSSHGAKSGVILDMGDMASGTLTPEDLKTALDRAGIRNRLIIVSS